MIGRRRRLWWLAVFVAFAGVSLAEDPYVFFDWEVSYLTVSTLGRPQQVIGINGQFPGPTVNVTTNWNVIVNVHNKLDESLLITWNGIQLRKNSWQDGVLGTNCPIPPGWNWTYSFQVKDQIGSFFYSPSTNFQRAAGGYGGIVVNNREVIPLPFGMPDADFTILIGDWYLKDHKELRKEIETGNVLGIPDAILFNGLGSFGYNESIASGGTAHQMINVEPGSTYRFRVHNVGISTCLNLRIQNHDMLLVETEGSYTVQQNYANMDIHVGQSYSFLITMDQNASSDYYIVASPRFLNASSGETPPIGVAILHYSNSQGPAGGPLPDGPDDGDVYFPIAQAKSIRWNLSSGAARPNPQGSFRYGDIPVTETYILQTQPILLINEQWRATLNDISYFSPATSLKLAQQYGVEGVYKLDFPNRIMNRPPKIDTSVINGTYKGFFEIIIQNNGSVAQSFHLDGYAFFVVGMDYGAWTENSRGSYNKFDAVTRSTTQVLPGAWTAIFVYLDNPGIWNLRTQNLDYWYLGQEVYVSVIDLETGKNSELPMPENAIYCGALSSLQSRTNPNVKFYDSSSTAVFKSTAAVLVVGLLAARLSFSWL